MNKTGKNGFRILVVDDETSVCKAIKMLLEFDGHTVETADGAKTALALVEKDRFDLIITDYSMGDIKGDRLAARIKETNPQQRIIMATAFADDFRNSSGSTVAAVDAVINKPFSLMELRDMVTQVME